MINLFTGITAFFLGALHALEPGHGKTAIAAYSVGYRSSLPQILLLGLSTALAHTLTILLLAALIGATVSSVADETTRIYIEIFSAVLLFGTGIWLWYRSVRRKSEDCGSTGTKCSCHGTEKLDDKPVSYGVVGLLGISTGILPCPTALAVLLSAMTAGQFFHGIWTVCLFSIGIAMTMSAVACAAMLFARSNAAERLRRYENAAGLASYLPVFSSWIIILSGLFTLVRAIWH